MILKTAVIVIIFLLLSICLCGKESLSQTNNFTDIESAELRAIVSNSFFMEEITNKQGRIIVKQKKVIKDKDSKINLLFICVIVETVVILLIAIFK